MRILHVIAGLDPRSGGPVQVVRSLVPEQLRAGHEVAALSADHQFGRPEPREVYLRQVRNDPALAGAELHLGRAYGRRWPWSRYLYSPGCVRWLRERLGDPHRRPDILHIYGVFGHLVHMAALEAQRRRIPYVLEPAGALDERSLHMNSPSLKRLYLGLLMRRTLRRAAFLRAASAMEAHSLLRWAPAERVRTIPLGIEIPSSDADAERLLARFPRLRGKRVALFLGRITAKKRPELLVEALARLRGRRPDLALLLAGDDDGHGDVVRAAARRHGLEEDLTWAGFLDGEDKQSAFALATVFALPSRDENYAIAVVEAMAHRLPVLVTPEVATHDYVDCCEGGVTVPGSAEALAEGLDRLLRQDLRAMGERGRQFVQRHLALDVVARQVETCYRQVA